MIRFHQTFGTHAGRVVTFDATRAVITFGRLPDRDVPFDPIADIGASGAHGEVRRTPGAYVVVDTGSRNGTFVNGKRVDRAPLVTGDEIEFGPGGPRLRVEVITPPPRDLLAESHDLGLAQTAALAEGDLVPPTSPGGRTDPPPPMPRSMPPAMSAPRADPTQPRPLPPRDAISAPPSAYVGADGLAPPKRGGGAGVLRVLLSLVALVLLGVVVAGGVYLALRLRTSHGASGGTATLDAASAPTTIARAYGAATYLVTAVAPDGARTGLCTAFAVRPSVLATSARCVISAESQRVSGRRLQLVSPAGTAFDVGDMLRHPAFQPASSAPGPDVGLVETPTAMAGVVPIATLEVLHALGAGPGWVYGYAGGALAGPVAQPAVTPVSLGAPVRFDGTSGVPSDAQLVPHDGTVAAGMAGGPVFDASGSVVAVESGMVGGRAVAVRADVVLALLAGLGQ